MVLYQVIIHLGKANLSGAVGYWIIGDTHKQRESKCLYRLWTPCDKWSPVPSPSYSQYNGSAGHPMMIFSALNASLAWFYLEADRTLTFFT